MVVNVKINGTQVLTNFDIFADAGGANKADVKQFLATADANAKAVFLIDKNGQQIASAGEVDALITAQPRSPLR